MITQTIHISAHWIIRINIFLCVCLLVHSCKPDPKDRNDDLSAEEIFMKDFEENPFKYGYINTNGRVAIEAKYDDVRDFAEGLAAVNLKGRWGYIDKRGTIKITPKYRTANEFSEGYAIVQLYDRQYITIDKNGNIISKGSYDEQHSYHNGLSKIKINDKYGYVNQDGIIVDTCRYMSASNFEDGYAIIKARDGYHIIDREFKIVSKQPVDRISRSQSHYWKYRKNDTYGYLDIDNHFSIWKDGFDKAGDMIDGIACVKKNEINYILKSDGTMIEVPFDNLRNLSHQRIGYIENGKYGIIESKGNPKAPAIYDALYQYADNRIAYQKNENWGYLDKDGQEITPPLFPLVWDFHNGLARVIAGQGIAFIDTIGNQVIPPNYIEVKDFYEGLARVQIFR